MGKWTGYSRNSLLLPENKQSEKLDKSKIYLENIEANLDQYNAKLAVMKMKAAGVRADMKLEYLSQMENLEMARDSFTEKYEELKGSNSKAWDDVRAGTETAWDEMESAIEKAICRFK